MANFTPQEIEQFLQEFFDVVGTRQYTGARYVPIFGRKDEDTIDWDDSAPYEPLTVVMHNGVSYVSKQYVSAGVDIYNTEYWAETYRFNAQVEQYRQEVLGFQDQIDDKIPFPNPTHYPIYGTIGQVLSTLADGTTKWVDPVVPSDQQAEDVITDWLNEHPEATTTVQDGAITAQKLSPSDTALFFRRSNLAGNVTLADHLDSGWYGLAPTAVLSDGPSGLALNQGCTLYVYNGTHSFESFVTQIIEQGNTVRWRRVLQRQSGTVTYDWVREPITDETLIFKGTIDGAGSISLAATRVTGWYGLGNALTYSDAPDGINTSGGLTLIVMAKTASYSNFVTQILIQGQPRRIWARTINSDGTAISGYGWVEVTPSYFWRATISGASVTLSDYRSAGWYGLGANLTITDAPYGMAASGGSTLIVYDKSASYSNFITQILIQGNPRVIWMRSITSTGDDISGYGWHRINTHDVVTYRTIEWYGDSTTAGYGGDGISYPDITTSLLELDSTNLAVSGRSVSTVRTTPTPMVEAFETEITGKNIIYFLGGTNDFWSNAPLGTIDSTDPSTFYGALNVIVSRLQTKFPGSCLILGTPFRLRHTPIPDVPNILPRTNSQGLTMEDYVGAIKEIAIKYGVPVVDTYNELGINPENDSMFNTYMYDGAHPNANGYKKIGVFVRNKLCELYSSYLAY